jgi:hypothetical protein
LRFWSRYIGPLRHVFKVATHSSLKVTIFRYHSAQNASLQFKMNSSFRGRHSSYRSRTALTKFFVVLVALFYGYMAHATVVSTSHDPASWSGHNNALLLAAGSSDHSHDHDSQPMDDHGTEHQHGQHTSDHSHDKSNLPSSDSSTIDRLPMIWDKPAQSTTYPEPYFFFERPPKYLPMS